VSGEFEYRPQSHSAVRSKSHTPRSASSTTPLKNALNAFIKTVLEFDENSTESPPPPFLVYQKNTNHFQKKLESVQSPALKSSSSITAGTSKNSKEISTDDKPTPTSVKIIIQPYAQITFPPSFLTTCRSTSLLQSTSTILEGLHGLHILSLKSPTPTYYEHAILSVLLYILDSSSVDDSSLLLSILLNILWLLHPTLSICPNPSGTTTTTTTALPTSSSSTSGLCGHGKDWTPLLSDSLSSILFHFVMSECIWRGRNHLVCLKETKTHIRECTLSEVNLIYFP
jgi:hypothetical protein